MLYTSLLILTIFGYLAATILIAKKMHLHNENSANQVNHNTAINSIFIVACCSLVSHLFYTIHISQLSGTLNVSLSSMTCVVSLILTFIFLLGSLAMPIRSLGILVFPLTAISLIFSVLWGSDTTNSPDFSTQSLAFVSHILISILSYSLITIAAIQALLYIYQERLIKNRASSTMLLALPPLQTMELLLFRLVGVGYGLLTLTLLSGVLFSQHIFGRAFVVNHHTLFAFLSWLVFSIMLFKRFQSGLRGSQAVSWTLGGFFLMQLGYFGTKFVTEILNVQ